MDWLPHRYLALVQPPFVARVMVLLHTSVNVHVSVSVPPHPVTVPVLTAVTVPEIKQDPEPEFV